MGLQMETQAVVDYAYPTMMAEKALKGLHNAVLEHKYDLAIVEAVNAAVEIRMVIMSLRHMKEQQEKHDALR